METPNRRSKGKKVAINLLSLALLAAILFTAYILIRSNVKAKPSTQSSPSAIKGPSDPRGTRLNQGDITPKSEQAQNNPEQIRQQIAERVSIGLVSRSLTQDKADKILAKLDEIESFNSSLTGKSQDERRSMIRTKRQQLLDWARTNSIPVGFLIPLLARN